jgi:hypothetical protein
MANRRISHEYAMRASELPLDFSVVSGFRGA